MGATMVGIIEWTHDAQASAGDPEIALGPPRWDDDYVHGILFKTDREYDFFAAVSGARNRFGRPNLIPPRGSPPGLSMVARNHFELYGESLVGWLHLSEIDACIKHVSAGEEFYTGFELDVGLDLMRRLVDKLTDPHVRLVFDIESS